VKQILKALSVILLVVSSSAILADQVELTDLNGQTKSISDFAGKGKWLVVMLWASDCQVCNREVHNYVDFHRAHQAKDAQVLGISLDGNDNRQAAKDFVNRHHVNFDNLIGDPQAIALMYQLRTGDDWVGTPSFMVFTPSGELLGAQAGAVPVSVIESFIERESASTNKTKS